MLTRSDTDPMREMEHNTGTAPTRPALVRNVLVSVASALAVIIGASTYVALGGRAVPALSVAAGGALVPAENAEAPRQASAVIAVAQAAETTPFIDGGRVEFTPTRLDSPAPSALEPAPTVVSAVVAAAAVEPPVSTTATARALTAATATPTPVVAASVSVAEVAPPPDSPPLIAAVVVPTLALTDREAGLVDAMNARRRAAGLGTLSVYDPLTSASRARSGDMLTNNYFAHSSPSGQTWYSLLGGMGLTYAAGGENLAKVSGSAAASVDAAIEALMASPTHRANILNPAYRRVGVGAASQGDALTIFTSIFTDR